jgi:hypothetical protein
MADSLSEYRAKRLYDHHAGDLRRFKVVVENKSGLSAYSTFPLTRQRVLKLLAQTVKFTV